MTTNIDMISTIKNESYDAFIQFSSEKKTHKELITQYDSVLKLIGNTLGLTDYSPSVLLAEINKLKEENSKHSVIDINESKNKN